jgi:hypothetical protein
MDLFSMDQTVNSEDQRNLNLLAVFHYVLGGITALFACFPLIHVFMGIAIVSGKLIDETDPGAPPAFFGWIIIFMGSVFILMGWALAVLMMLAGKNLKRNKNRMFCMVVAGIECIFMPFGTVLGILTLVALNKDSVRRLFHESDFPQFRR